MGVEALLATGHNDTTHLRLRVLAVALEGGRHRQGAAHVGGKAAVVGDRPRAADLDTPAADIGGCKLVAPRDTPLRTDQPCRRGNKKISNKITEIDRDGRDTDCVQTRNACTRRGSAQARRA